jgi:hypothetical protein
VEETCGIGGGSACEIDRSWSGFPADGSELNGVATAGRCAWKVAHVGGGGVTTGREMLRRRAES